MVSCHPFGGPCHAFRCDLADAIGGCAQIAHSFTATATISIVSCHVISPVGGRKKARKLQGIRAGMSAS
jgi:hypothetical protein